MSFFNVTRRDIGGIHNPFESPTVPLSSLALDQVFGSINTTESGERVTEDTALNLPIFWRCVGILGTVVSTSRLRTWYYETDGTKTERFPAVLSVDNPNTMYTPIELWDLVVVHMATWGNAFVRKVRGMGREGPGTGIIVDLQPYHPSRVDLRTDDQGNKIFLVKPLKKDGTIDWGAKPIVMTTWEIMHIPARGVDGVQGDSAITRAKRTLGTAMAADRLATKFFANGTALSGVIQVKMPLTSQTQADGIRERWLQKSGGVAHAGEVAILDSESTFMPLTIPPDNLQFLQSRRWQTTEIARWFGIPPHLVGDVEKSTSWGTGIEQQNIGFVSYTVKDYTGRIEQRTSREVIHGGRQHCHFDISHLLQGTMQERYSAYSLASGPGGWLLRNEVRKNEGYEDVEGFDEPLVGPNDVPMDMQEQMLNQQAQNNSDGEGSNGN